MVTTLNSATAGRDISYGVEQILRKTINATDGTGQIVVGGLPANALITGGQISVTTAFTTTAAMNIGYNDATSSNTAAFASAMVITALGTATLDEILTSTALPLTRATTVVAQVTGTSVATGTAEVVVRFIGPQ